MGKADVNPVQTRVAVLISGRGSNLKALIAGQQSGGSYQIALVVSNRSQARGLTIASEAGVPTRVIDHTLFDGREPFERVIDQALNEANVELVCLGGFMRVLTPWFVKRWQDRLLNIHPSLLPAFRGLDTHARALNAGVRVHGCTVHFVRPELDNGPIVVQGVVPVIEGDTEQSLAARVLETEHRAYPEALELITSGRARLIDGRIVVEEGWAGGTIWNELAG